MLNVTLEENFSPSGSADDRCHFSKLAGFTRGLDLDCLFRHVIGKHATRVLPPPQDQRRLMLVAIDNGLFNIYVDGRFDRAHESGAHIDARCSQAQSCHQSISICESPRGDKGGVAQLLTSAAVEDQRRNIGLSNVTSAFESVNRQNVHAESDGRFRVSDGGGFVDHRNACRLELLDDRSRAVASGLNDLDTLIYDGLSEGRIIWRVEGGQESEVDTERVSRQGPGLPDLLPEVFRIRLCEGVDDAQSAGIADSRSQFGIRDPLEAPLDNWDSDTQSSGQGGVKDHA